MKKFRIKPGYIILMTIAIIYIFFHFHNKSKAKKDFYIKKINSILTDIRREDYFAMQNKLSTTLSNLISIEDIKNFMYDLNITRKSRFELTDIEEFNKTYIEVVGIIINNKNRLPAKFIFEDVNKTLRVKYQKIYLKELKYSKKNFPLQ